MSGFCSDCLRSAMHIHQREPKFMRDESVIIEIDLFMMWVVSLKAAQCKNFI
jgi:hypothetical protein